MRRARHHQPKKDPNDGDKYRETSGEPSSTRHNYREANKERQVKSDIQKDGHHQPDWETNEGRQVKRDIRRAGQHYAHKLGETSGEPGTTRQTGKRKKGKK